MSDVTNQDVDKLGGVVMADTESSSSNGSSESSIIDTNNETGKPITDNTTDHHLKHKATESWTENEQRPRNLKSGESPEHGETLMPNLNVPSTTIGDIDKTDTAATSDNQQSTDLTDQSRENPEHGENLMPNFNIPSPTIGGIHQRGTASNSNNQQSTDLIGQRDGEDDDGDNEPGEKQVDTEKKSPYTIKRLTYCLKITYLVLLFILILGTGCLSRVLMHIMIWKLSPPHTMDRHLQLVSIFGYIQPDNDLINRTSSCVDSSCSNGLPLSWTCTSIDSQTCSIAEEVPSTNVAWFWAVMLSISTPYFYTFLTNLSRYCTKFTHKINYKIMVVGIIRDLIHSAALCLLVFFVLPTMAPDMAALSVFIVTSVPVILNINLKRILPTKKDNQVGYSQEQTNPESQSKSRLRFIAPVFAGILFLISIVLFVLVVARSSYVNSYLIVETVFACIFVSVEWFESFVIFRSKRVVSREDEFGSIKAKLFRESETCQKCTDCTNFFHWVFLFAACKKERENGVLALIKLVTLNLVFLPLIVGFMTNWKVEWWRLLFVPNVNSSVHYHIHSKMNLVSSTEVAYGCNSATPFIVMIICVCSTFVFFKLSQHACRIQFQKSEFAVPILLNLFITPIIMAIVQWKNLDFIVDGCSVLQPLWKTTFDGTSLDPWFLRLSGITGFLSIILMTLHVFRNTNIILHKATKLFSKTTYCGLYPDVSLLLSRKAREKLTKVIFEPYATKQNVQSTKLTEVESPVPIIIACATMWHEEYEEMCKLLTSVLRLGFSSNKKTYGFEAHILFDDAFMDDESGGRCLNKYANDLYEAIYNSMRLCYKTRVGHEYDYREEEKSIEEKTTEYGWRVEWKIIGKNAEKVFNCTHAEKDADSKMTKLIVHFKDKTKIRVKKRWSQVMYMHYLLTKRFKPMSKDKTQKLKRLQQTFILALDGDVDFQPDAVDYLLQGMARNNTVGACCGRIHPIGSGPMIWYQKFEYAASHWLQKSTEHVCGCVLCSPGCFTLFRGSAIVDENVLATYSKEPKTPWQMVQFDQGEDRWLCTLLLKQGYRVEYCAASDAKTFAPEGFTEFFKQRRRWSPSTIANIIDILASFRYCAEKNDSISKLYLVYQGFLLCTAIITPASILLLMIGAFVIAFDFPPWAALILVLTPTVIFTISIFAFTEDTQLFLASIISGLYAIVMMIVIIGIIKAGVEAGFCSETTILICFVGGIFVVAAIIHPRELTCIFPGLLYFFAVPSVSVVLMIYAVGNIHITSWGTREGTVNKKQKGKEVDCSFGSVCRCILFPDQASSSNSVDAPKFRTQFKDTTLAVDETLDLRADITGYPKPKITWYLDNRRIHRSSTISITFDVSTVRLKKKNMQLLDSGTYCCVAENESGKCKLEAKVRVEGRSTKPFKPSFRDESLQKTIKKNFILLETEVTGLPRPVITWKKDGEVIPPGNGLGPRRRGSNLSLKLERKANFRGIYTCIASNDVGTSQIKIDLNESSVDKKRRISAPADKISSETKYWKSRIEEKNKILDSKKNKLDAKDQEAISAELRDLRNKVFFGFILINVLYFTFVFTLTQADSTLNQISFDIPCPDSDGVLRLNPILIAFIVTFGIVLSIQFWGMIYHRMSTFVQIILSMQRGDTKKEKVRKYTKTDDQQSSRQMDPQMASVSDKWKKARLAMSFINRIPGRGSVRLRDIIEENEDQSSDQGSKQN